MMNTSFILNSLEKTLEGELVKLQAVYGNDALAVLVIGLVLGSALFSFFFAALAVRFRKLYGIGLIIVTIAAAVILLMAR